MKLRQLSTAAADFTTEFERLRHWSAETDAAIEGRVAEILADVQAELARLNLADPTLQASVRQVPGSLFVAATEEVPQAAEPVASLTRAYRQVLGEPPLYYRKNAYCDTIRFSHAGIPSVTFGPGEDGWPPTNEYIHTPKAVPATRVLALAMLRLLGGDDA